MLKLDLDGLHLHDSTHAPKRLPLVDDLLLALLRRLKSHVASSLSPAHDGVNGDMTGLEIHALVKHGGALIIFSSGRRFRSLSGS